MKNYLDKLRSTMNRNRKVLLFLIGLLLISIIAGSVFYVVLSDSDQTMVSDYMTEFLSHIKTGNVNRFSTLKDAVLANGTYILLIWFLGISVLGLPIALFLFFSKGFVLGFSVASIIAQYKLSGALLALLYVFPHTIINIILFLILTTYSVRLSIKIIKSMILKTTLDFRIIMTQYRNVLLLCIIGSVLTSLYESFALPYVLKLIVPLLT